MPEAQWFDRLYDTGSSMEQVYRSIIEALVTAAVQEQHEAIDGPGEVLYAVPGSPVVAEHTVELLLADERIEVVIHPALSFLDLTWARLGIDPVETGVRLVRRPSLRRRRRRTARTAAGRSVRPSVRAVRHQARWWTIAARFPSRCCSGWGCRTRRSSRSTGRSWTVRSRPTTSPRCGSPSSLRRSRPRWCASTS